MEKVCPSAEMMLVVAVLDTMFKYSNHSRVAPLEGKKVVFYSGFISSTAASFDLFFWTGLIFCFFRLDLLATETTLFRDWVFDSVFFFFASADEGVLEIN